MDTVKIILCSKSKRRKFLIKKLGFPYIIHPVKIDENLNIKNPAKLVKTLALMKAEEGAKHYRDGIVLGADTVVVYKRNIIGKPLNNKHAEKILKILSGSFHKVYTGVALINCKNKKRVIDYEVTRVKMRKLSDSEIKKLSGKHIDKAGAYAVQEKNDAVVEKIHGDYYNVVGLPLNKISKLIKLIM